MTTDGSRMRERERLACRCCSRGVRERKVKIVYNQCIWLRYLSGLRVDARWKSTCMRSAAHFRMLIRLLRVAYIYSILSIVRHVSPFSSAHRFLVSISLSLAQSALHIDENILLGDRTDYRRLRRGQSSGPGGWAER